MAGVGALIAALAMAVQSPNANPQTLLEDVIADVPSDIRVGMDVYLIPPLTSQTAVEDLPGHRHPGHMYVYVLEGAVRSKLGDEPAADFSVGQAWQEQPGQLHRIHNISNDQAARLLVVRLDPDDSAPKD